MTDSPNIIRWNRETNQQLEYGIFPEGFISGEFPFRNIIDMGDELYLIPFQSNRMLKLNKNSGKIDCVDMRLPYAEDAYSSPFFENYHSFNSFAKRISETKIFINSLYDASILVYDVCDGNVARTPLRFQETLLVEAKKSTMNLLECREQNGMPLNKFLEYLVQDLLRANIRKGISRKRLGSNLCAGSMIHAEIMRICKSDLRKKDETK